ncbi:MAG: hypothetical protein LLG09_06885 [Negativicutes bacterium]|nr:hypothetical protein [Negativicutes bacterium]
MVIYHLCKVIEGLADYPSNDERSFGYFLSKQKAESHPEYQKYIKEETAIQKKKARYAANWRMLSDKDKIAYYHDLNTEAASCHSYWYIREISVIE